MNATFRRLVSWGRKWQVKFAPAKTPLLLISRSQCEFQLEFDGAPLTLQEVAEVLGVTYDSRLSFWTHIQQLARSASKNLACLSESPGSWTVGDERPYTKTRYVPHLNIRVCLA